MAITTTVDGTTAIKYTAGTNLEDIGKKYNMTVDEILVFADRENDSLEKGITPLAVGDVIIIRGKENNNANPQQPTANTEKEDEEPIFTEEKVTGAIVGGTTAALTCACLGAKYGGTAGSFLGPLGTGVGIAAGALIGAVVGWWIGDACD